MKKIFLFFILISTGCAGSLVEYPKVVEIEDVNQRNAHWNMGRKKCTLLTSETDKSVYRCNDSIEILFATVALGIALPIPYGYYTPYSIYTVIGGKVSHQTIKTTRSWGRICGLVTHNDVIEIGCWQGTPTGIKNLHL